METPKRGKFVVFEGIDGSGKSTQIKMCASFIYDLSKEYDVYMTREPTRNFKEIRTVMAAGEQVTTEWYAGMFVKDRRRHVEDHIEPALARGTHVLCDRYKHSTLAYQNAQGIPMERLQEMHAGLLVPDLTIVFDCEAVTAYTRIQGTDVFEKDREFQEKLRGIYLSLGSVLTGERVIIVKSDRPAQDVAADVEGLVRGLLDGS